MKYYIEDIPYLKSTIDKYLKEHCGADYFCDVLIQFESKNIIANIYTLKHGKITYGSTLENIAVNLNFNLDLGTYYKNKRIYMPTAEKEIIKDFIDYGEKLFGMHNFSTTMILELEL